MKNNKMKKIAFFSPVHIYPIFGGLDIRIWELLKVLSKNNEILLIVYNDVGSAIDLDTLKKQVTDILVIDLYHESRIMNALMLSTFFINKDKLFSYKYINKNAISLIKDKLKYFNPDISIFGYSFLVPLMLKLKEYTGKTIVDMTNIEYEIQYQYIKLKNNPLYKLRQYIRYYTSKRLEKSIHNVADQIWVVSERDKKVMSNLIGKETSKIRVIPNSIDINKYKIATTDYEYTIGYMGSFGYNPNSQAAEIIITDIFPKVKKRIGNAKILFIGASPTPFMLDAANENKNIILTGFVENISEYLSRVAIVIVPLIMGGGTRFKILEALALGKPVISTPKGAEGLDLVNDRDIIICELNEFPNRIIDLLNNNDKMQKLINTGIETVRKYYSTESLSNSILQSLSKLGVSDLEDKTYHL